MLPPVAALSLLVALATQADYTAPRNATLDARGATRIEIEGKAGDLRVTGVAGLTQVRVTGTARASREAWLADIKLVAERHGDRLVVRADIPDDEGGMHWGETTRALDLVIEVPQGLAAEVSDGSGDTRIEGTGALDVADGSGDLEIANVASATVRDGSGDLTIHDVQGDVRLTDGSGDVTIRAVRGAVTIEADGSGEITAEHVGGTFTVERDGSGSIEARDVGGDFVVERDGSGSVSYSDVKGAIRVPERYRRRG